MTIPLDKIIYQIILTDEERQRLAVDKAVLYRDHGTLHIGYHSDGFWHRGDDQPKLPRVFVTHLLKERETLTAERNSSQNSLFSLLARIHRDGGHYVIEHGMEKAIQDAHTEIITLLTLREELEQKG